MSGRLLHTRISKGERSFQSLSLLVPHMKRHLLLLIFNHLVTTALEQNYLLCYTRGEVAGDEDAT